VTTNIILYYTPIIFSQKLITVPEHKMHLVVVSFNHGHVLDPCWCKLFIDMWLSKSYWYDVTTVSDDKNQNKYAQQGGARSTWNKSCRWWSKEFHTRSYSLL